MTQYMVKFCKCFVYVEKNVFCTGCMSSKFSNYVIQLYDFLSV